jgi:hypothetical protein
MEWDVGEKCTNIRGRIADCCYFVLCCVAAAVGRMRGQGLGTRKKRKTLLIVIGVVSSICCILLLYAERRWWSVAKVRHDRRHDSRPIAGFW